MLEGIGGILASSITVVDETNEGSLTGRCMPEGRRGQLSEHILPAGVSDAATRTAIEGKGQIKPTFLGLDGGDVALPELARAIRRRQLCQPVFRDLVTMATLGGARPKTALLPGTSAGGSALFVQTDVRREDDIVALVEKTVGAYGALHTAFQLSRPEGGRPVVPFA